MQKSAFIHRRAFYVDHTGIEHPAKEMDPLEGASTNYVFLFLPNETGYWTRKFFCSKCEGCRKGSWRSSTGPLRGCDNLYAGAWSYHEFELAFCHKTRHINEYLQSKGAVKKGKKEITLKEVRSYLLQVLDTEELDPKLTRKLELADLWDGHYVPLLKRKGLY